MIYSSRQRGCKTTIVLLLAVFARSDASAKTWRDLPDAPQLQYQRGVPHTDAQGRLRYEVDATSFLPRCIYETLPGTLPELARVGFNCFKPWNGLSLREALEEAHVAQIQLIKQFQVLPCRPGGRERCDAAARQIAGIQQEIAAAASSPDVLGWYIDEEPTACINEAGSCGQRFADFSRLRAAIRGVDPVHPAFALDVSLPKEAALEPWTQFNGGGDIAAIDNYPFHTGDERTLESSVADYRRLVVLNRESKPVWITVQDFGLSLHTGMTWTLPTAAQLRAQVFAALVHGATGIIYFALDSATIRKVHVIGISPAPQARYATAADPSEDATPRDLERSRDLWTATLQLNAELARLAQVLLAPTDERHYRVAVKGDSVSRTPIRTLLKRDGSGHYTLFAVNIDALALELSIDVGGTPAGVQSLDAAGVATRLPTVGGRIVDSIGGFGVRIYQFD